MPDPSLDFTEGAPLAATTPMQMYAVIGFCSAPPVLPPPLPGQPVRPPVLAISDAAIVLPSAGRGPAPELAWAMVSRSKTMQLLVAAKCSAPGTLSPVTQKGPGPLVTCVPDPATPKTAAGPWDDGFCSLRTNVLSFSPKSQPTYQLAYSYVMIQGVPIPLYQAAQSVPPRMAATAIGTVPLSSLTYATPAIAPGTADITALVWGPGGDLDGKDLQVQLNGGATQTVTFNAPGSVTQALAQINAVLAPVPPPPPPVAALSLQDTLTLTSPTLGKLSTLSVVGGTAVKALGLTVGLTKGTAGDLDGQDLQIITDAGSDVVAFGTPAGPADVVAEVIGPPPQPPAVGLVSADLYLAAPFLRIASTTIGGTSTLTFAGGSALATLGFIIPASPYKGAESSIYVPHLGVTWTIAPGVPKAGTEYGVTMTAPAPTASDAAEAIDAVYAKGYKPIGFVLAQAPPDGLTALAFANAMAAKVPAVQVDKKAYPHVLCSTPVTESDDDVKTIFDGFRSVWIDMFVRGVYGTMSTNIAGSGAVLRSQVWAGGICSSVITYHRDRGDHSWLPNPLAGWAVGVTVNENGATTKLVPPIGSDGLFFNVLDGPDNDLRFSGGYTSAGGLSRYNDQSTRNAAQGIAGVAIVRLGMNINRTEGIYPNPDGTLSSGSATAIDGDIESAVEGVMSAAIQRFRATTDTKSNYKQTKTINVTMVFDKGPPARAVAGTLGPGDIGMTLSSEGALST